MKKILGISSLTFCLLFSGVRTTHAEEIIIKDRNLAKIIKEKLIITMNPQKKI